MLIIFETLILFYLTSYHSFQRFETLYFFIYLVQVLTVFSLQGPGAVHKTWLVSVFKDARIFDSHELWLLNLSVLRKTKQGKLHNLLSQQFACLAFE